ncbi:MAG: hypothetical protein HY692_03540 [Cyanobacteria bacterium NC_groundwater_1444_Ag_S-0.65um_54_12]|nr:hypothetical protein [Cyanobacteria bacterium NC_groundwater_1444_Ag_S-0.65um_54_12]
MGEKTSERQYQVAAGQPKRHRALARRQPSPATKPDTHARRQPASLARDRLTRSGQRNEPPRSSSDNAPVPGLDGNRRGGLCGNALEPGLAAWFSNNYQLSNEANEAISRKDPCNPEKQLVALIDAVGPGGAIDGALFEIEEPTVTNALLRAKQDRNVAVRLVTDTDYYYDRQEPSQVTEPIKKLLAAGIPIVPDRHKAFMHHKFLMINRKLVWTGSFNISENGAFKQNNNAILLRSSRLAADYRTEFEQMFSDQRFGAHKPRIKPYPLVKIGKVIVEPLFSQDDVNVRLAQEVRKAKKSVKFMAFAFTDKTLGQAMLDQARDRKLVEGIFERRGANSDSSRYPELKAAGLDVHMDGNPQYMHHKVIIIDDTTLITGSFNFSKAADNSNDENLVIIRNAPRLVKKYLAEYQRVKATALAAEKAREERSPSAPGMVESGTFSIRRKD